MLVTLWEWNWDVVPMQDNPSGTAVGQLITSFLQPYVKEGMWLMHIGWEMGWVACLLGGRWCWLESIEVSSPRPQIPSSLSHSGCRTAFPKWFVDWASELAFCVTSWLLLCNLVTQAHLSNFPFSEWWWSSSKWWWWWRWWCRNRNARHWSLTRGAKGEFQGWAQA